MTDENKNPETEDQAAPEINAEPAAETTAVESDPLLKRHQQRIRTMHLLLKNQNRPLFGITAI